MPPQVMEKALVARVLSFRIKLSPCLLDRATANHNDSPCLAVHNNPGPPFYSNKGRVLWLNPAKRLTINPGDQLIKNEIAIVIIKMVDLY